MLSRNLICLSVVFFWLSPAIADRGSRHAPYLDGLEGRHVAEGLGKSGNEIEGYVAVACKPTGQEYSCVITTGHGVKIHRTGSDGNRVAYLLADVDKNLSGTVPVRCVLDEVDKSYGCYLQNEEIK